MIIIPLHGYNVTDRGAGSVDTFAEKLTSYGHQYLINYFDYGWVGLLFTRFGGIKHLGRRLAKEIELDFIEEDKIVLLCHSNGMAVAHECIKHTDLVDTIISFNGALDEDAVFDASVKKVVNFHTEHDKVLKYLAWLRPFHKWGRMGATGYKGEDPRVVGVDMPDVREHSQVFQCTILRDKYVRLMNEYLTS